MKHFFVFILALILSGAMALGSISHGVTASNQGEIERIADNTPSASRYSISGSRNGIVTVKNAVSSEVIRTFQMDAGVVVRETFLLDGGKTVAASQKDHAVFWELATGREIRRFPQRIYGFSHDETKFFTYKFPQGIIFVHSYPSFTLVCKWKKGAPGPEQFRFSPNDRFLNITFRNGYPPSDENYPLPDRSGGPVNYARLFDIETCADEEPWYWNEYRIPEELEPFLPWNPASQLADNSQNNGQVLQFSDVPQDYIKANNLKFETFLIGDFGNKTYDFLTGFSWSISLNGNGTSTITEIKQGATFTKQYANLVEQQFGYKKVEKLPTYLYSSALTPGKVDPFDLSGLQASAPFVAWTNNFPGVNPPKKPDTILGEFNQSGNLIAVNDDGGPFGSNWGSGIKSSVNNDGSLKLKVSGYNDFNFDQRNDFSGGPCNGGSGGGGCVRNAPHPQVGKYDLAVKMNQDYLPSRSSVSISSSNVGTNTRTFAARSINQEMSFSESDVSDIASLYSDDLPNEKASSQKAEEDALAAAAVPEPTTALGTLLALGILPVIKRLKNRKNQK